MTHKLTTSDSSMVSPTTSATGNSQPGKPFVTESHARKRSFNAKAAPAAMQANDNPLLTKPSVRNLGMTDTIMQAPRITQMRPERLKAKKRTNSKGQSM